MSQVIQSSPPVNPHPSQILLGQLHHSVEPLPEGERSVREGLLTELGPGDHQIGAVRVVSHVTKTKCFPRQELEVVLSEAAAAGGFELHVESVGHLQPGNFLRHDEGLAAPLSECVVPEYRGPGVRLLVPVHDDDHGQRGGAHLVVELTVADGELGPEEKGKLLVHHGLRPFLLRPLDLLETHVPEADGELPGGLVVLHGLLVVDDVPRGGLLGVASPQQGVGLTLGDDGGRHHGRGHVDVELGAHQQADGGAEPGVRLQHLWRLFLYDK